MKATEQIEFKALNRIIDKLKEIDDKHGWIDYFIAPVLVAIILLIVYAMKGVYPFGVNTIAYYDMPTNGMASYSWLYDFLHGKTGMYLDWNIGLGASNASGASQFFPLNWFFLFVNRDGILYAVSFFLMIKLELIAFSMSFYIKKKYGSTVLTVCLGILYAFCGYVLQYYSNIDFIDFTIILPFIVYALERLLIEHKCVLFTILMFFMFMCSIQLMFMLCMYIVFKSYFILKDISVENKARSIRLLIISAISAACLAGFVLIPMVLTLSSSVRVTKGAAGDGSSFDYLGQMKFVYNTFRRQKQFMMYGSEIAVGLLLYTILRGKEIAKKYADNIAMIAIVGLPILHEGINLLWHMGSYKHFPIRFGYMLTFECLIFAAKYFIEDGFISIKYVGRVMKLIGTAAIPFVAYVLYKFFDEFTEAGIADLSPYHTYWLYLITLAGMYFIIFLMESQQARKAELLILAIIQGFCGCYGLIAPRTASIDQYRIRYARNSIELRKEFGETVNRTDRIKMDPGYYDPNDSILVGQPTISYWSYGINGNTEDELQQHMEYNGMPTCTLDSGGTVFTDALLGVKYTASLKEPDYNLYTKVDTKNNIYSCNYTMPFGLVTDKITIDDESKGFEYQNNLFKEITGVADELISIIPAKELVEEVKVMTDDEVMEVNDIFVKNGPKDAYININNTEDSNDEDEMDADVSMETSENNSDTAKENEKTQKFKLSIATTDKTTLYMSVDDTFKEEMSIITDGKPIYTSSFETYGHFDYPNDIIKGILALGSSENKEREICIHTNNKDLKGVEIGLLNLDVLNKGIEAVKKNQDLDVECGKSDMHITGRANRAGTLFLPIGYSDNWHARMNGKKVAIKPYINNAFIAVDVPEGDVNIEFSYRPKGLIIGFLVSFFGLILGIVVFVFEKRGGLEGKKCKPIVDTIFIYGYNAVVVALFIVMYVVPIWIKMSL